MENHLTIYNGHLTQGDDLMFFGINNVLVANAFSVAAEWPLIISSNEHVETLKDDIWDYDNILGYYVAEEKTIVLLEQGISQCSNSIGVNKQILRSVVLAHELGHYITHAHESFNTLCYDTDLFNKSSADVLESFAQIFTVWATMLSSEYRKVFDTLLRYQSGPYQVFMDKKYCSDYGGLYSQKQLLESLDGLRLLSVPATCEEWDKCL